MREWWLKPSLHSLRTQPLLLEIHHPLTLPKHLRNISALQFGQGLDAGSYEGFLRGPAGKMHLPLDSSERTLAAGVSGAPRSLIFVVEDDADIARLITHNLRASGFSVQSFSSGAAVISDALREMPSLFLLDVMLPGTDGFELCRHIRQTPALSATPVIFLTAKAAEADRVKGLELGGDDYITKPFSPRELVARIRSVLRGLGQESAASEVLRLGDLEIDVSSMTVQVQGRNVLTTVREFRLLEYLAAHRGRVLTRDQLLDAVWKETPFVTPRSIDVYIRRLREKIELDPRHPQYLKTLRGIGYRFEVPKDK
jgi:two-component system phosphate regulon response regulator PhoB